MKSSEFITEEDNLVDLAFKLEQKYGITAYDIHYALKIKRDCQPFIKQTKGNPFMLYRGVSGDDMFIEKETRLKDREPTDMNPLLHSKINVYMMDHFGKPYRNALFVTGDPDNAEDYGDNMYYVFPQGKFSIVYAENVDYGDLYQSVYSMMPHVARESQKSHLSVKSMIQDDDLVNKFLDDARFSQNNLIKASNPEDSREIMIWTEYYYGIRSDYEYKKELSEIILT